MTAVTRTVRIPSGETLTVRVPEEWGAEEVKNALMSQGVDFGQQPASANIAPKDPTASLGTLQNPSSASNAQGGPRPLPPTPEPGMFDLNRQVFPRETAKDAIPIVGGMALAPAAPGVIASSLLFGGGAAGGEMLRRTVFGNETVSEAAGPSLETGAKGARDSLVGGTIFKMLAPFGRNIFGKPIGEEGNTALRFARDNAPETRRAAKDFGAPRLMVDDVVDGEIVSGIRFLSGLAKLSTNGRLRQSAEFVNNFISKNLDDAAGIRPGPTLNGIRNAIKNNNIESLSRFKSKINPSPIDDLDELITKDNLKGLAELRKADPVSYRNALDLWLGDKISGFTRSSPELGTQVIDGQAFRAWVKNNLDDISAVYGKNVADKLDGFSAYTSFASRGIEKAEQGIPFLEAAVRLSAEGAGKVALFPAVALPAEGAGTALANALINPSSASYKLFAEVLPNLGRTVRTGIQASSANSELGEGIPSFIAESLNIERSLREQ